MGQSIIKNIKRVFSSASNNTPPGGGTPVGVIGSGTTNKVAKFTGASTIGDGLITDDGTSVYNTGGSSELTNTAFGRDALISNTTGTWNTSFGNQALKSNTTGGDNHAFGHGALTNNTTGSINIAIGTDAMIANISGGGNIGLGTQVLSSNTTGSLNVAIGGDACMSLNVSGAENTCIGYQAGRGITNDYNCAFGKAALYNGGRGNSAFGYNAGITNSGLFNVFIGYSSGFFETGSNKLFIDNQSRANEADGRLKSLLYGVFDADPANQLFRINAEIFELLYVPVGNAGLTSGQTYFDTAANILSNGDLILARKV